MEANKLQRKFDKGEWELVDEHFKTPVQTDGNSCGIHVYIAADFISDNLPLSYSHKENPTNHFKYLRVKLCSDILRCHLDYPYFTSPLSEIDLPTYLHNYRTDPPPHPKTQLKAVVNSKEK